MGLEMREPRIESLNRMRDTQNHGCPIGIDYMHLITRIPRH
jgi:hypothetical protein